ncbi:hypothetical protein [Mesorhizobium sp.]|uniref:hypothetical protein n=1 Tax=Mesorhizobium sp. TaxID=1871066 RepID=UPI00257EF22D|nr:hypothetical protein [Mesorhizobium sp.]
MKRIHRRPQRAPACAFLLPTPYMEHSGNILNRPADDRPEHGKERRDDDDVGTGLDRSGKMRALPLPDVMAKEMPVARKSLLVGWKTLILAGALAVGTNAASAQYHSALNIAISSPT